MQHFFKFIILCFVLMQIEYVSSQLLIAYISSLHILFDFEKKTRYLTQTTVDCLPIIIVTVD